MRITVAEIPAGGRQISFGAGDAWARDAVAASLETAPRTLEGSVSMDPADKYGQLLVQVEVHAAGEAACDRCGDPVQLQVDSEGQWLYAPESPTGANEVELGEDELDVGWYSGGVLDVASVLQEVTALAMPARILCADTAGCDKRTDALLAAARADEPEGHPGFAVLKDLS